MKEIRVWVGPKGWELWNKALDELAEQEFCMATAGKVVHCRKEEYDVYIGRPSKWGNPFSHKEGTKADYKVASREEAVEAYRTYITQGEGRHLLADLEELRGKRLGCWCSPKPCHGDVLIDLLIKSCGPTG